MPSCDFNFSSKVKRTFDTYDSEDQENVDPATLSGSGKKAKGSDGAAVKPRQVTHFSLTTVKKPAVTESSKIARATLGVKPRPEQPSTNLLSEAMLTRLSTLVLQPVRVWLASVSYVSVLMSPMVMCHCRLVAISHSWKLVLPNLALVRRAARDGTLPSTRTLLMRN